MTDHHLSKDILTRVDLLESRMAIGELVAEYCQAFDRFDYGRFLAIWWNDCTWNIGPPYGCFERHAGIERAVKDVLWPVWRQTHHLTSNLRVRFDGPNDASGESDVGCMGVTRDDVVQMIGATYHDHFQRRNGIWRFKRRDITIHYFNPIPGAQMSAPPK